MKVIEKIQNLGWQSMPSKADVLEEWWHEKELLLGNV